MSGNRHRILQACAPEFHHWPRENLDAEDEPAAHSSGRLRQLLRAGSAPRGSRWRGTSATADRRGDAGGSGRGRVGFLRGAQTRRPLGDAHRARAPSLSRSRGGSRAEGCVRAAQPGSSARAGRVVARGQTGFHRRILPGSLGHGADAGRASPSKTPPGASAIPCWRAPAFRFPREAAPGASSPSSPPDSPSRRASASCPRERNRSSCSGSTSRTFRGSVPRSARRSSAGRYGPLPTCCGFSRSGSSAGSAPAAPAGCTTGCGDWTARTPSRCASESRSALSGRLPPTSRTTMNWTGCCRDR